MPSNLAVLVLRGYIRGWLSELKVEKPLKVYYKSKTKYSNKELYFLVDRIGIDR